MLSCTIAEVRHVEVRNLKFKCITPFTSANGGDYAHMLELFMIVDFPNGKELLNNKGSFYYINFCTVFIILLIYSLYLLSLFLFYVVI